MAELLHDDDDLSHQPRAGGLAARARAAVRRPPLITFQG